MVRARTLVLCISAVLLLALSALGQAPPLDVTLGPGNAITIINRYSLDATAYVNYVEWQSPDGKQSSQSAPMSDRLGLRAAMAAGAVVVMPLGQVALRGGPLLPLIEAGGQINVSNKAVIYADGATAGDPVVIAILLRDRGYKLAELRQAVPFLLALTPDSDFAAMARICGDRALAENRAWPSSSPLGAGKVFRDLRGELTSIAAAPRERRGAALQALRDLYAKILAAYAASKPPPPLPPEVAPLGSPPAAASSDNAGPVCGDSDDPNQLRLSCVFDGKSYEVDITNARNVPATAVALRYLRKGSGGWNWSDTLSLPGSTPSQDLQPGMTRRLFMGPNATSFHAVVIYADGVTAGDLDVVARFLAIRAAELADVQQVVPILQAAVDDPLPDRAALAAQFDQRARAFAAAMRRDRRFGPARDPVCGSIYQALTLPDRTGRPVDLHAQLRGWLHAAQLTLARLESSLPPLPQPASR